MAATDCHPAERMGSCAGHPGTGQQQRALGATRARTCRRSMGTAARACGPGERRSTAATKSG
eukprot:5575872-Alexandrium_andersonii.AAC.1